MLGHLAKNVGDVESTIYLIQRIEYESDKYILSHLLDRISDLRKPFNIDIGSIIFATQNENWLIRHSAITALNNSENEVVESTLLQIIDNSKDPYDIVYSNAILTKIGTTRAILYLEKHLTSKKRDVKNSAKYATQMINQRNEYIGSNLTNLT